MAAGCEEEKRTWDLVVVLVVEQTACHQEGGWSTRYLHFLQVLNNNFSSSFILEIFTKHLTIHCLLSIYFSMDIHMDPLYTLMCVALANWIHVNIRAEKTFRAVQC